MGIVSDFVKGKAAQKQLNGVPTVVEAKLDFSETNVSASDVVEAIKLPKGALVTDLRTIVDTAEGGAVTLNIGDAADIDGFDAAVNGNVEAITKADGAYLSGKEYSEADTIDVIPSADLDTAVVRIIATYIITEL